MGLTYEKYASYYDLIYSTIDYALETDEILKLLSRKKESIESIIDLGCGTGSYSIILASRGYTVEGIDSSFRMIDLAMTKAVKLGVPVKFRVENITDMIVQRNYDAAICIFGVLDYLHEDSQVRKFFAGVHECLSDDDLFVLAYLNKDLLSEEESRENS